MADQSAYKRPASPGAELSMPPAKIPRTGTQVQINYLKKEKKEIIPLVTIEEPLPRMLRLMSDYDGVLQRHESLAGNLGACPVGPILLKRFEKLFDGPPRILKSNNRDPTVSWLDVVDFARNKPEQFDLEKTRNGVRVCQFYLKQCRVEISEEDYVLIRSGLPQKLMPPQPILEDEEKELGVIDVLDRNLGKVIQSADQVSARARQLVHRLKNRRAAILARREAETDPARNLLRSNDQPQSPAINLNNGLPQQHVFMSTPPQTYATPPAQSQPQFQPNVLQHTPANTAGFTAVNPRHSLPAQEQTILQHVNLPYPIPPKLNGTPPAQATSLPPEPQPQRERHDNYMDRFLHPDERAAGMTADTIRRSTTATSKVRSDSPQDMKMSEAPSPSTGEALRTSFSRRSPSRRQSESAVPEATILDVPTPTVAIPGTPVSIAPVPLQKGVTAWTKDDGGVHKAEMMTRTETMKRGERVVPPCDRCRRLHMDCIKNLTACAGCTKKHAKCAWKEVTADELEATEPEARARREKKKEEQRNTTHSLSEWDTMLRDNQEDDKDRSMLDDSDPRQSTEIQSQQSSPNKRSPAIDLAPIQPDRRLSNQQSPHLSLQPSFSQHRHSLPQPHFTHHKPRADDIGIDDGDRLAAVAAQVYRTASQNAARANEP